MCFKMTIIINNNWVYIVLELFFPGVVIYSEICILFPYNNCVEYNI